MTAPRAAGPGQVAGLVAFKSILRRPTLRRVLWLPPIVFAAMVVTFLLMHLAPGDPWERTLGDPSRPGPQLDEATVRALDAKYGLDRPLWDQFTLYLANAARLDFGTSYQYQGASVRSLIADSLPETAVIGAVTFVAVVTGGIALGAWSALRHRSAVDYAITTLTTLAGSIPNFVVGILLIVAFSVGLNRATNGSFYLPSGGYGLDEHLVLPVVTLALWPMAFVARLTRSTTLEVLEQDYVRTARAKGLRERYVMLRHVLKNAIIPVVTVLGPMLGFLLTGAVVVETLFSIPGVGGLFVQAVRSRDYPVILGTTILYAVVFPVANLAVDLLYGRLDPRVRAR